MTTSPADVTVIWSDAATTVVVFAKQSGAAIVNDACLTSTSIGRGGVRRTLTSIDAESETSCVT